MPPTTAPHQPLLQPIRRDWTIEALLDWIAEDDARCHDDAVRPALLALTARAGGTPPVACRALPAATVALVRDLAVRVAGQPSLRAVTIGELLGGEATELHGNAPLSAATARILA